MKTRDLLLMRTLGFCTRSFRCDLFTNKHANVVRVNFEKRDFENRYALKSKRCTL